MVPCGKNGLKVKVGDEYVAIKNLEEFSFNIDSSTETTYLYDLQGYQRALKTGLGFTLDCSCKREFADPAQESIIATAYVLGEEANREFKIEWADGSSIEFVGVVAISNLGTGTVTDISTLEFSVTVDGLLTETPAPGTGE